MQNKQLKSALHVLLVLAFGCDTDRATEISATSAKLNLKPHSAGCPTEKQPCTVYYEVSPSRGDFARGAYGDAPLARPSHRTEPKLFPDDAAEALSQVVSGLAANTQYYFRLCGGGSGEPVACASVKTFRTASPGRTCAVHTVSAGSSVDHGDPTLRASIAGRLAGARTCDVVELADDATYEIQRGLVVPNGVTLRGKHDDASYENQKIIAGASFPPDTAMVLMRRGSVLHRLWADGMNRAYRVVELTNRLDESDPATAQFRDYVIQENLLRHTYNGPPTDGSDGADVSVISGSLAEHIDISDNEIRGAGIHMQRGWGAGYTGQWQTKGRGVLVRRSNDLYIVGNTISHTTMAGIDLTSGRGAFIHGNLIEWTGRNSEYKTSKNDRTKSIQDGITGYHNYRGRPADEQNLPNAWRITANTVRYAGNHGIHVGGYDIKMTGNTVEKIFQSGINFYDQRNDAEQGFAECNVHVQVGGPRRADKNIVRDTGYTAPDATLYRSGFAWTPVATQLARKARYEGMPNFNMTTEDNDLGGGRVTVDTANASCGHRFGF